MTSTWYSRGGPSSSDSTNSFVFDFGSGSVYKFFFYFENVATRGKSTEDRAMDLFGHLVGEGFDFYYDEYASNV